MIRRPSPTISASSPSIILTVRRAKRLPGSPGAPRWATPNWAVVFTTDQSKETASRPIRSESRTRLVAAIARGRLWLSQIETGAVDSVTAIALREDCSPRHVNMTISLAFLAPSLVKAAVEGRLPRGIGLARLIDAPAEWARQHKMLGLAP